MSNPRDKLKALIVDLRELTTRLSTNPDLARDPNLVITTLGFVGELAAIVGLLTADRDV